MNFTLSCVASKLNSNVAMADQLVAYVGDVVRYGFGETALMRLTSIRELGNGACLFYGKGFHSHGTCTSRGEIYSASDDDLWRWRLWHDPQTDAWTPQTRVVIWVSDKAIDNPK